MALNTKACMHTEINHIHVVYTKHLTRTYTDTTKGTYDTRPMLQTRPQTENEPAHGTAHVMTSCKTNTPTAHMQAICKYRMGLST